MRNLKHKLLLSISSLVFIFAVVAAPIPADAGRVCGSGDPVKGTGTATRTAIDLGCQGKGNAITDATFAIIRFLSVGVGLVIVGSLIVAGIQYSGSRGDPQATAAAIGRIQATLIALVIFIFGFAILNYLIPAGFLE